MKYKIAVIKGDGIGPEIVSSTLKVMEKIGGKYGHEFEFNQVIAGGAAIDETGAPLPEESLKICLESDSVLLGAVGGPKWDGLPGHLRPEKALLGLRKALGLYANLRPVKLFEALQDACPLKPETTGSGIDLVVVRELTGGIYFGKSGREGDSAYDTETYSRMEVERIGKTAFELARKRRKRVCSIDKANVLTSSQLWREMMHELCKSYPDVQYSDMLVDNAAMQLIRNPSQFDVMVTSNMFGDIISDEASMLTGSIGMLPSASLGESRCGMYEPIHGSAPDIAGQGKANPIATILSAAMMLRLSFDLPKEADVIEKAVVAVLAQGYRTPDIRQKGCKDVKCDEMTELIIKEIVAG